jgi:hypothetical protein
MKIIFPPRPKNALPAEFLNQHENKMMFGQPKSNGSFGVLYMNETTTEMRNRHKEIMTNVRMEKTEMRKLYRGSGQMILCGEYMNKNKKHINGAEFNHKYILFDILMYNGVYLLGKTFQQRQDLLDILFPEYSNFDGYIRKVEGEGLENVYRANNFYDNFNSIYDMLVPIDMYEGLVVKKMNAGLEIGIRADNNHLTQFKVRKQCAMYNF